MDRWVRLMLKIVFSPKNPSEGDKPDHSQKIPLEMVFLGQFNDHDITLETSSALDQVNDENAT